MANYELQEMLDSLDLGAYLDYEGIEYREKTGSSGDQYNLHYCPACGDSKWRVWMNQESGLGNCFHGDCHLKTFNKWSFIREHLGNPHNRDVIEHIKQVSRALGWRPKRVKPEKPVSAPALIVSDLPTACIPLPDINGNNLDYLEKRGINGKLAERFALHYCFDGSYSFANSLGEREQQFYGKRVIIPLFDYEGRMISFQGRDTTGQSPRKYLFPPGKPSAGKFLWAGHLARGKSELVLVEGVMDAMSAYAAFDAEAGLSDVAVAATFGMHLSSGNSGDDQLAYLIRLKHEGLKRVTFMWDSEPRAIKAAMNAAQLVTGVGLDVRIAILPDGKDPNDCLGEEIIHAYYNAVAPESFSGRKALTRKLIGAV